MRAEQKIRTLLEEHPEVREAAERCLSKQRWNGSVVLMVIDAAFTSIGVNYFTLVVPRVEEFREKYLGDFSTLEELSRLDTGELQELWRNRRSWEVARGIASKLVEIKREEECNDLEALALWASRAELEHWKKDVIGQLKGVGINTFQYLRMMGGVDTVMPDKIVKRFINKILEEAGESAVNDDIKFIGRVKALAERAEATSVELCFLAWMEQYRGEKAKRYAEVLRSI